MRRLLLRFEGSWWLMRANFATYGLVIPAGWLAATTRRATLAWPP